LYPCFFASDLHGRVERYRALFRFIAEEAPRFLFLGGDLLPMAFDPGWADETGDTDFVNGFLAAGFQGLRDRMRESYPTVFLIPGNDDPRAEEESFLACAARGLWRYAHGARFDVEGFSFYGYAFTPPSPFALKDWERYDVSRFTDPGCVSPEEGHRSVPVPANEARYRTIREDLAALAGDDPMERAVFLFHGPPYKTLLDRADLGGRSVDHAPLDVHVGSIAIRRFIEERQPLLTLHGHVHESPRLTGVWRDRLGRTHLFSAAHDGPQLALVRFDLDDLEHARRELHG
jgi:Icc-related predicted phosphoesterase